MLRIRLLRVPWFFVSICTVFAVILITVPITPFCPLYLLMISTVFPTVSSSEMFFAKFGLDLVDFAAGVRTEWDSFLQGFSLDVRVPVALIACLCENALWTLSLSRRASSSIFSASSSSMAFAFSIFRLTSCSMMISNWSVCYDCI